ncbi:RluA family pseudouridine synthase [Sphingobacteriales bacterium UPWRP_1]|nr:RNA pseudouridine synthase [Sphingobacteriales bacterium TSM_CSM]PSJ78882.1 RluA family pseudouridine synthase [Sphingobacteriales bacterium UPWRP_1]
MEILYEDNHVLAVNKAPGVLVQSDITGDICLADMVKLYLKETYNKPGNVFAGVVHRIDRPVSGVVLFAKTGKALERLNQMFKDRTISKTYWAVVKNKPNPEQATLVHYLIKDPKTNKSKAYLAPRPDTKRAELHYELLRQSNHYYLLQVTPITGRHHQIRAQLSAIGCPIKGDVKYGFDRPNPDASIHLHARSISFVHPVKKNDLTITANPPHETVWNALTH